MTTQEMHIEIDLDLQKINSQNTKNLLPQEKDWFLNREVINYLISKTTPSSNVKQLGFEDTAKRVEDIKDFIRVKNIPIETNNRGEKFIVLPSNYFGYIRFDAYSYRNCSNINIAAVNATSYRSTFKIELPATELTAYKIEVVTPTGTKTLFDLSNLPSGYFVNAEFKKQKFLLINALKVILPRTLKTELSLESSLYWEIEGYNYEADSFILETKNEISNVIITTNVTPKNHTVTTKVYSTYAKALTPLKAKIRVIDDEFLSDVETSHLSKSRANSPTSALKQGVLELSNLSSAIFGSIDITYICKPNIIDLLLDSNLNVSNRVAKEVVGNTIRVLKNVLQDQNYQAYAQENILTE